MNKIHYKYLHVPTIKRFSESRKFLRGLMGPFGSGKSSGCCVELIQWGTRQPVIDGKHRARFAVIRNTYRQLEDTTIRTFHDWLPPAHFGDYRRSDHTYLIDRLDPELEIEILFRALDRPEHVANLLSMELTGAFVNEAREVPFAVIKALQGRVGRYPAIKDGGAVDPGIIMDTNPPDEESWWYELFEDKRPDNAELFRQPSGVSDEAENVPFLPTDYYKNLMAGADEAFIKVHVHGEYGFVKSGKPVYPEYNDSIHCAEVSPVEGKTIKRGFDFGLSPACVFSQVLPSGRFAIIDELCATDLGIERFSDVVLKHSAEKYPGFTFQDWGDPAGGARSQTDERTCFDIMRGKGIAVEPSEQSVTLRIESVKKSLNTLSRGKPEFIVHPRCRMLRRGFQGRYQYKRMKITGAAESFKDKPEKNSYSHIQDALAYVAVKVYGDTVRSRQPWRAPKIEYDNAGVV